MVIRAVGGVALRDTANGQLQVLLIRKQGGMWTLPKGRVKRGETDEEALRRELREETGLSGEVGEVISQRTYRVEKNGRMRRKVVVYYLIWETHGDLSPSSTEKIVEAGWVPLSKALKRIGRPGIRTVVRSALTLV